MASRTEHPPTNGQVVHGFLQLGWTAPVRPETRIARAAHRFFDEGPESVTRARSFTRRMLIAWHLGARAEDVCLCVSELATNALTHGAAGGPGFLVRLTADRNVVVLEVWDRHRRHPRPRQPTTTDHSGRGLVLVDALADSWGSEDRPPFGKSVWSRFEPTRPESA